MYKTGYHKYNCNPKGYVVKLVFLGLNAQLNCEARLRAEGSSYDKVDTD